MKIKWLVINARREFVNEHFGADAWDRVLSALPIEDQKTLGETMLATAWFPYQLGDRLDRAIVKVLGKGDQSIFEELGVKSAQKNLAKNHKAFLIHGDPQGFMRKAGAIYQFYYDTGRREYRENGPCSGELVTYDAETFSVPDCLTVVGWYKEALRMCGAREVTMVEEECRATGGSCCRYRVEWKM